MKKNKKSKKLQKIAKFLYDEVRLADKESHYNDYIKEPEPYSSNYAEFDEDISKKFKKFILSLISLKDKIRVDIDTTRINISGDLNSSINTSNMGMSKISKSDDYIDIRITKDGFCISRNHGQTISYKDISIYNELSEKIQERSREINKDILIDMIDDVMIRTNLSRQSNLDDILG